MPATVIDSSVVTKWFVPETDSALADAIVREAARTGEPWVARLRLRMLRDEAKGLYEKNP